MSDPLATLAHIVVSKTVMECAKLAGYDSVLDSGWQIPRVEIVEASIAEALQSVLAEARKNVAPMVNAMLQNEYAAAPLEVGTPSGTEKALRDWTPEDQAQHTIISMALDEAMQGPGLSSNPADYPKRQTLYAYCNRLRERIASLESTIRELTRERDEWKADAKDWKDSFGRLDLAFKAMQEDRDKWKRWYERTKQSFGDSDV